MIELRNSGPRRSLARHAVAWGAALHTYRVGRRLDGRSGALQQQAKVFRRLSRALSRTEFGREFGIELESPPTSFAKRVAPRRYEALAPWIERMKRGETDILWPGSCSYYAVSSGTTAARTKYLPITRAMLAHFRQAGLDSLCWYARRRGGASVFRGRHLFLGGSTSLAPIAASVPFVAWSGDLSGITALNLPGWVDRHLYEPGREIAQISDWSEKLSAIVARTVHRDITLVAGIPSWLLILAEKVAEMTGRKPLQALWPHLECVIHGGVPIAPYREDLQEAVGAGVNFHEVYPASEGFIAAQDEGSEAGLRLMTGAGIYYEFLPLEKYDDSRLADLGSEVLPLEAVLPGVDYALIMTTPAGLCRYVIGDVVRFVSIDPFRLVYAGRTQLQLSAFGEHVIEKELTDALVASTVRCGLAVSNFHVAPRFVDLEQGEARGRHEWWIECRGNADSIDPVPLALALDEELQLRNDDYEAKRKGGGLAPPRVRLVEAGTFEVWLRARGKWGGQNKMPRCRSDRLVADALEDLVLRCHRHGAFSTEKVR